MCGRVTETDPTRIVTALGITGPIPEGLGEPRYNVPPSSLVPVVRVLAREPGRRLHLLKWGLVPRWAKDASIGNRLINARLESLADKPAYRDSFERRRCLVVVDGFYEWQRQGKTKQPFHLHDGEGKLLGMAGVWDRWTSPDGEIVETFAIVTKPAEHDVVKIHDRMPAILHEGRFDAWLGAEHDPSALLQILSEPSPSLVATPVSARVNKPDYDEPDCVEPVPEQRALFE